MRRASRSFDTAGRGKQTTSAPGLARPSFLHTLPLPSCQPHLKAERIYLDASGTQIQRGTLVLNHLFQHAPEENQTSDNSTKATHVHGSLSWRSHKLLTRAHTQQGKALSQERPTERNKLFLILKPSTGITLDARKPALRPCPSDKLSTVCQSFLKSLEVFSTCGA